MFVWRVDRILEEFQNQMPEFIAQLMQVEAGLGRPDYRAILNGPGTGWPNRRLIMG